MAIAYLNLNLGSDYWQGPSPITSVLSCSNIWYKPFWTIRAPVLLYKYFFPIFPGWHDISWWYAVHVGIPYIVLMVCSNNDMLQADNSLNGWFIVSIAFSNVHVLRFCFVWQRLGDMELGNVCLSLNFIVFPHFNIKLN